MNKANKTAKNIEETVMIVRLLFLHTLRQAICSNIAIKNSMFKVPGRAIEPVNHPYNFTSLRILTSPYPGTSVVAEILHPPPGTFNFRAETFKGAILHRTRFIFCLEKKLSSNGTSKSMSLYVITVLFPGSSAGTISQRVGRKRPSRVRRS